MNRKHFLLLAAASAVSCQTQNPAAAAGGGGAEIDAGPAEQYAADGVYEAYASKGFFIVRHAGRLFAMSAVCTHRRCDLEAQPDHSFYCPCHGSTFTADGHVTKGPAVRDLPVLASRIAAGRLLVRLPA